MVIFGSLGMILRMQSDIMALKRSACQKLNEGNTKIDANPISGQQKLPLKSSILAQAHI